MLKYNDFEDISENTRVIEYYFSTRLLAILNLMFKSTSDDNLRSLITKIFFMNDNNNCQGDLTYLDVVPDNNNLISFFELSKMFQFYYKSANLTGERDFKKITDEVFRNFLKWLPSYSPYQNSDYTEWVYANSTRTSTSVGRLFQRLFQSHKIAFTAANIEKLANLYKAAFDMIYSNKNFTLVQGEEIRKWYLVDNYQHDFGDLNNSCMRYAYCQPYFDLYVKNPNQVQLLILQDDVNKIIGRALVWQCSDKTVYVDRVYTAFHSDVALFKEHAAKNGWTVGYSWGGANSDLEVVLDNSQFNAYPYMDTFSYLSFELNTLFHNYHDNCVNLNSTDGGYEDENGEQEGRVYSNTMETWLDEDDAVYCEDISDYMTSDRAFYLEYKGHSVSDRESVHYSDYAGSYILAEDSVHCDYLDDYYYEDQVVSIYISSTADESSYVPEDYQVDKGIFFVNDVISGHQTLSSLCYCLENNYYFKDWEFSLVDVPSFQTKFTELPANPHDVIHYLDQDWVIVNVIEKEYPKAFTGIDHLSLPILDYIHSLKPKNYDFTNYLQDLLEVRKNLPRSFNLNYRFRSLLGMIDIDNYNNFMTWLIIYALADPTKKWNKVDINTLFNEEWLDQFPREVWNKMVDLKEELINLTESQDVYTIQFFRDFMQKFKDYDSILNSPGMLAIYQSLQIKKGVNESMTYYPQ